MAKTIKCEICGREVTTGFFKGEAMRLEFADCEYIDCCPECYERYKAVEKAYRPMFTAKLANYTWQTRNKLNPQQKKAAYLSFIAGAQAKMAQIGAQTPTGQGKFYIYNENGVFGWSERRVDFLGSDISSKDKLKALKKNLECDAFLFTKEDVSCLRYRLGHNKPLGLFKEAYSVEICINPQEDLSFRPTFGKTVVVVSGLFGKKKKARREMQQWMELFRSHIGCTHLPIEEVKKFK